MPRCPGCEEDILSSVKYCPECGREVNLRPRTVEEIEKALRDLKNYRPYTVPGLPFGVAVTLQALSVMLECCLRWCMGHQINPITEFKIMGDDTIAQLKQSKGTNTHEKPH